MRNYCDKCQSQTYLDFAERRNNESTPTSLFVHRLYGFCRFVKTLFQTSILRFIGLIDYDRHLVRFLSQRSEFVIGEAPGNIIHRDGCICIMIKLMDMGVKTDCFNDRSLEHSTRKEFYDIAVQRGGGKTPLFTNESTGSKIIPSKKLQDYFQYIFRHRNPIDGIDRL